MTRKWGSRHNKTKAVQHENSADDKAEQRGDQLASSGSPVQNSDHHHDAQEVSSNEFKNREKDGHSWKDPISWLTAALVFVGLLQFGAASLQWNVMNRQLRAAAEQFAAQEEPQMWAAAESPQLRPGDVITSNVLLKNYGHSLALNVASCMHLVWGRDVVDRIPEPTLEHCENPGADVFPPSMERFTRTTSAGPVTKGDLDKIRASDGNLVVVGVIRFEDALAHQYMTSFCSFYLATGEMAECPRYNSVIRLK